MTTAQDFARVLPVKAICQNIKESFVERLKFVPYDRTYSCEPRFEMKNSVIFAIAQNT